MFYSHEVLTSRKYGVATIWLVATLGQTSSLRKVSRKAILNVNVPKACESILMPEAPLALRLQSNLLYGISRVFSQQCGYVLSDAQHAQNNIRALMSVVRAADLDPEASRARPDQLLLEDDPAFLPDFTLETLNLDLPNSDTSVPSYSQLSNILSLPTSGSSRDGTFMPGFNIPFDTTRDTDQFALDASETRASQGRPRTSDLLPGDDENCLLPEADFTFDAEGNIIELTPAIRSVAGPSVRAASARVQIHERSRVTAEHREGQLAGSCLPENLMDVDHPPIGDDRDLLEAEALLFSRDLPPLVRQTSSAIVIEESPSSEAAALRRRVRVAKTIPLDTRMELGNRDLINWNTNYLSNMADKNRESYIKKAAIQAKKNAQKWILGGVITSVTDGTKTSRLMTHLDMFAGATLYEMTTGLQLFPSGKKRSHEDEAEDVGDSRRLRRPRFEDEDQIGRGVDIEHVGEGLQMHSDVEMPREVAEGMEDVSSAMPWNITASIRGSSVARPPPGSRAGSQGRFRMISASPLTGRTRPSDLDPVVFEGEGYTSDSEVGKDVALGGISETQSEKSCPATHVDKQTTAQQSWQQDVIDQESSNFREFVERAIKEKRRAQGLESSKEGLNMIEFNELLPPESNSRVVTAQAFLHILSLASKNVIIAAQKEAYGPIDLRFIPTNA